MCGIGDDLSGENIDFIFVLGGDGSIISAARKNAALKIPIVGINFGKLGYLAELEVSELGLIEKIISGEAFVNTSSPATCVLKSTNSPRLSNTLPAYSKALFQFCM